MIDVVNSIRVLLVDDHDMVRQGLAVFLDAFDDLELVGEASDGADALIQCGKTLPDVILMDLMMPGVDGLTAIQNIRREHPKIRIIALTSFQNEELVPKALQAGAIGYLYKDISIDELAAAIRSAHAGTPVLSPAATRVLIDITNRPDPPEFGLTKREYDVLILMVEGLNNVEIAQRLVIGRSTVKTHVSHILAKLDATNRQEAISQALRHKLVS